MKSKFKIGDEIFFLDFQTPKKAVIKGISFTIGEFTKIEGVSTEEKPHIIYSCGEYTNVEESKAFKTKEEFQDSFFKEI